MDGFSYTNIFDTKGIEYIIIIVFFLLLIPFWIILNKDGKVTEKLKQFFNVLTFDTLKIPQGIFYGKNHTWAFMEKSGNAYIGIDDFLGRTVGEVKPVFSKTNGEMIMRGELLTELVKENKSLKIFSPISGKVLISNNELAPNPELLNDDPYGKGWIYKIKPTNWVKDTNALYLAEDALSWSKTELERLKEFVSQTTNKYSPESQATILQDGGELKENTLSQLHDNAWVDFQENFLNLKG